MKTAAIVVDDWKLPMFKKMLNDGGYEYSEHFGPMPEVTTLKVETENLDELLDLVKKIQKAAAASKLLH